jgi:hypothetical protein
MHHINSDFPISDLVYNPMCASAHEDDQLRLYSLQYIWKKEPGAREDLFISRRTIAESVAAADVFNADLGAVEIGQRQVGLIQLFSGRSTEDCIPFHLASARTFSET